MGWGGRNDWPGSCTCPGHSSFLPGANTGFCRAALSAGVLLCPPCWDVILLTPIAGFCTGRPDHMPATSLAIHSLMGLGTHLEPGFLKLYFNGFTLVNPSERACKRE